MARSALIVAPLIAATLLITTAHAARDIKRPEQVFIYDATTSGSDLIVNWTIEDGYYLYRDKMKFIADGLELGDPIYPAGEIHADEFFGEQVVFRNAITVRIPVTAVNTTAEQSSVEIRSQGCADFGLCYPPQKWKAAVPTPKIEQQLGMRLSGTQSTGRAAANLLGQTAQSDQPLRNEEAFIPSLSVADPFTLNVRWDIAPGYYLYKKDFAVSGPANVRVGSLQLPTGTTVDDLEYGNVEVYFDSVTFEAPLSRNAAALSAEFVLAYQGCKEDSICYPPAVATLAVDLPAATTANAASTLTPPVSEQVRLFGVVADAGLGTVMIVFLGLGLLLAFSPCCLPMVPILSGIIAGQGDNITTSRSFFL